MAPLVNASGANWLCRLHNPTRTLESVHLIQNSLQCMFEAPYPPYDPSDETKCVELTLSIQYVLEWLGTDSRKSVPSHRFVLGFYQCSYETVSDRWPNILAGMINHLGQVIDDLPSQGENASGVACNPTTDLASKVREGNKILSQIRRLKDRMGKNLELELSYGEMSYILNPPFVTSKYQVNSG